VTFSNHPLKNMSNETFRWQIANRQFERKQRGSKHPKRSDKLAVSYQIRVTAGERVIKELASSFEIPEVRDRGYLSATAADFPQLFDMLVAKPLATAVAVYQLEQADSCGEESDPSGAPGEPATTSQPEVQFRAPQVPTDFPDALPEPPALKK
jgi:hypothetical protein